MIRYAVIKDNKIIDLCECYLTEDEFHIRTSEASKQTGNRYVVLCDLDKDLLFEFLRKLNSMVEELVHLQDKISQTMREIGQNEDEVKPIYDKIYDIINNYRYRIF